MHIVGIGASAGGLRALRRLLVGLSPTAPAAYVVVQHLPPDEESALTQLLQQYCELPVVTLEQDMRPERGNVYVMTGNKNVVYKGDTLHLESRPPRDEALNLPIDRFFHSIGQALRAHSVGIVLSGTGTDGSLGIRTIKENGGLVLLQDPATAEFPGMIKATQQLGLADEVLPPEDLARILNEVLQQRNDTSLLGLSEPQNLHHFQRILDHISNVNGTDFHDYRPPTLARRIEKRMTLSGHTDLATYQQFLVESPAETKQLFADFLIGVTRFFRNRKTWTFFAERVVPELFDGDPQVDPVTQPPVRVWVPACASGEEAYTIALLLADYRDTHATGRSFKVFATDVDQQGVKVGSQGIYTVANTKSIPAHLLERYFVREAEVYRVRQSLRDSVLFAVHDCLKDPPFVHLDLISCRNFLIYLRLSTQRRLLGTFHFSLHDKGYLLLGPSETVGILRNLFGEQHGPHRLYRKRSARRTERTTARPQFDFNVARALPTTTASAREVADDTPDTFFVHRLLAHSVPPSLFVDESLDVHFVQGDIDDYFHFPKARARFNLHRMTTPERADLLQRAVRRVLRLNEPQLLPHALPHRREETTVSVSLQPVRPADEAASQAPLVLLQLRASPRKEGTDPQQDDDYLRTLEFNLSSAQDNTDRLVANLETANLELEAGNRELKRSNEELQTTNAELQSVNEELYTVNGELQIKNEELTIANNDILNLLRSSKVGTLFLDADLRIRRFTPDIRELFDLVGEDTDRPIDAFSHRIPDLDLSAVCREVYDTLQPFRREVHLRNGSTYLLDVLPYRTQNDTVRGLVVTLFNIDTVVANRRENLRLVNSFNSIFHNSGYTILFISPTDRVTRANRPLGKYSVEELEDTQLLSLFEPAMRTELERCLNRAFDHQETTETLLEVPTHHNVTSTFALKIVPIAGQALGDDEEPATAVLIAEDISDIYSTFLTKQEVLSAQQRIYEKNRDQVVMLDPTGLVVTINYTHYTQQSTGEVVGQNIFDMVTEDDRPRVREVMDRIFAGGTPEAFTVRMKLGERMVPVESTASPVYTGSHVTHLALHHENRKDESATTTDQ